MTSGIGATITTLTDGTTAHAGDVMNSLNSLNSNGISNDGVIVSSGSGDIVFPNNHGVQIKDSGGTARAIVYLDAANETCLQGGTANGVILFKNASGGTTICGVNTNGAGTFQWNDAGTLKDILYVDNNHELCFQMSNSSVRMYWKNASGSNLMSLDGSGNLRCLGTVTGSTTP